MLMSNTDSQFQLLHNMKYSINQTLEEAQKKVAKLEKELGIPDGKGTERYAEIKEHNNKWYFEVRTKGAWKANHLLKNLTDLDQEPGPDPEEV